MRDEADVEAYLVRRVRELGGEVRKVVWPGRRNAPDRLVMLPGEIICGTWTNGDHHGTVVAPRPGGARTIWVEVKHPEYGHLFPMNPHERAQLREHERMRAMGLRVVVVWTKDQVEELLS